MPIAKLPTLLINQIAAGEVIERPASVVKELIENSLDAGATRIDVAIEDGGRQLIRISDDGCGIPADQLPLAISPHATSKLKDPQDLQAIATLGFRGEALASIASISRTSVTSRPHDEQAAATIQMEGDHVSEVMPAAQAPGTVVQVRDLFFNTPARRKFLRQPSTEFGHINETIQRLALTRPHVRWKLTHNHRTVLDLPAEQPWRDRVLGIMGQDLDEAMLETEAQVPGASLKTLLGLPHIARATAKAQHLCINNRPVRDRGLSHAIKEAYRGLIPPDRHPVVAIMIEMDPTQVDVNVHPTKAEVRFREPNKLHGLVLHALRQRLLGADLTPKASFATGSAAGSPPASAADRSAGNIPGAALGRSYPDSPDPISPDDADNRAAGRFPDGPQPAAAGDISAGSGHDFFPPSPSQDSRLPFASPGASPGVQSGVSTAGHGSGGDTSGGGGTFGGGDTSGGGGTSGGDSAAAFVEYFKRMAPTQKGFVYQQVRQAMADTDPQFDPQGANDSAADAPGHIQPGAASSKVPAVLQAAGVLQVHQSYLVTQDDQGLLIIDQHALHERVMFEQLRRRVLSRPLQSQRLLMPAQIALTPAREQALEQLAQMFTRIGIEAEPMGPSVLGIHAFPTFLFDKGVEPGPFVEDLLDRVAQGEIDVSSETADEAALHEVLDMMSCKAAVKAGDKLSAQELADLLAQRKDIERSSNCPHGRPTTIRMTLRDLEKQFKRT